MPTEKPRRPNVHAVLNTDSGSALDPAQVEMMLREVARVRGWDLEFQAATKETIGATLKRTIEAKPHAIVIGGGDGTIRGLVGMATGTGIVIGVLPMGTMNFVAKDLGMPLDVPGAIMALATARVEAIDVGEVNGKRFLHSSTIGIVPKLTVERERVRHAAGFFARARALGRALSVAAGARRITLEIEQDQRRLTLRTFSLIISNNELSRDPLTPYKRPDLRAGTLIAYIANHKGRLGLVRLLATMGSGWWHWDGHVTTQRGVAMRVRSRGRLVPVTNDGEIDLIQSPLRYRSLPAALTVFVPASPADPAADAT